MSETQKSRSLSSPVEERKFTPNFMRSDSDMKFFQFLYEFIEAEKKYLQCPAEGPDELRYIVYRSTFNKVIGRATANKRLLMAIKSEYDNTIRELERRQDEVGASQRTAATSMSLDQSLMTCQGRANQLRDRISVLQTQTAELQRQTSSSDQSCWIAGLTAAQSEDPAALDGRLAELEIQRAALLDRRSRCVPLEVQTRLDAELQTTERHRHRLGSENDRLKLLCKRLRFVSERLSSGEEDGLRLATLQDIQHVSSAAAAEDDDAELFVDEEPTGLDESQQLQDYLDRFVELFDASRYEDAALLAARSPRGILRNLNTMQMFAGVEGPPGSAPPPLLFFWALLVTMAAGDALPAPLSLTGVGCSLKHGNTQLVMHAVAQNKLTISEELGNVLSEHAQKDPGVADVCLPLATSVYEACRADKKAALSMCRRGLTHSAVELMMQSESVTPEDCLWVLRRSPSLPLLQLMTAPPRGRAGLVSVGVACAALLADPQQHRLALQLLDGFVSRGRDALQKTIVGDGGSSVDVWNHVVSLCYELQREDLSRAVRSVLLDQSGTGVRSPDLEGARLMDHVFM